MTDNQFVVRVGHILTSTQLKSFEKLGLISLSYCKMAFPEKEIPPAYNMLMRLLYGEDWVKWDEQTEKDVNFFIGFEACQEVVFNMLDNYDSNELARYSVWDFIEKFKEDLEQEIELQKKDG